MGEVTTWWQVWGVIQDDENLRRRQGAETRRWRQVVVTMRQWRQGAMRRQGAENGGNEAVGTGRDSTNELGEGMAVRRRVEGRRRWLSDRSKSRGHQVFLSVILAQIVNHKCNGQTDTIARQIL